MKQRFGAFATLTALSLMILLVAYLSVNADAISQNQLELRRSTDIASQSQAWKLAEAALDELSKWDATKQRFSQWAQGTQQPGVTWQSLSGKVNLNTVTQFILALPAFQQSLAGGTVSQFTDFRNKNGPASDPTEYAKLVDKDFLSNWYTVYSTWDINTADEIMLENVVSQRLGSSSAGSAVRALVRSLREQKKRLSSAQWQDQMGANAQALGGLVNAEPELDVNEVPVPLLSAFLTNPDWGIEQGDSKAQSIVGQRDAHPMESAALQRLLGVPDDHIALSYLGTKTRFVQLNAKVAAGVLTVIVHLTDVDTAVKPKVVSTTWTPS